MPQSDRLFKSGRGAQTLVCVVLAADSTRRLKSAPRQITVVTISRMLR